MMQTSTLQMELLNSSLEAETIPLNKCRLLAKFQITNCERIVCFGWVLSRFTILSPKLQ